MNQLIFYNLNILLSAFDFPMKKSVKKAIIRYLSEQKRVNKKLNSLVPLLNQSKDPVHQIMKRVKETDNPLKLFKALLLIHVCYLRNILNYRGVLKLLPYIKPKQDSNLHLKKVLATQVIPQYKLYLQLCYEAKIDQYPQTQQKEKNNNKYSQSEAMEQIYKNIRLLKHGLDFVQILFLFGRYYRFQYFFIIDFNIVLAKDLQIKYNKISNLLTEFKQMENHALLQKLEKMHQSLYIVYYNCYYHTETKKFQPNWIETDVNNINNLNNQTVIQDLENISELVKLYEEMRRQNRDQFNYEEMRRQNRYQFHYEEYEEMRRQNRDQFHSKKKQENTHVKKNTQMQTTASTQKRQTDSKQSIKFSSETKIHSQNKETIVQISQFQANEELCESEQVSEQEQSNQKLNEVVLQIDVFDDKPVVDDRFQKYRSLSATTADLKQQKDCGIFISEFNEDHELVQICGDKDNIMELIAQNTIKI